METNKFVKTKPQLGSDVSNNTEEAKTWLDSVSPSMCLAKWFHVSLHLTNGRTSSCYHPPTHKIDRERIKDNPKALHNTKLKKKERKKMLQGKRPEGCRYCWDIEDAPHAPPGGHRSDRHYRSGEHWAAPYRERTLNLPWDYDFNPTYVEVNFNQACNFKCSYCSPHLSSEWQKEIEKFGPYPTTVSHNNIASLTAQGLMPIRGGRAQNPYVEAFWKWWPEMYRHLHVFRMTGGEPLLDVNTFRVLEYVASHPKGDLEISITSNLCPPDDRLLDRLIESLKKIQDYRCEVFVLEKALPNEPNREKWPRFVIDKDKVLDDTLRRFGLEDLPSVSSDEVRAFYDFTSRTKVDASNPNHVYRLLDAKACKHFSLFVSLDAWGPRAEYIRYGMRFDKLLNNIKRVLLETHFSSVTLINTFNLLSVTSFPEFLKGVLELRKYVNSFKASEGQGGLSHLYWRRQRIWFDVPLLRYPDWQSVQNLPREFESFLIQAIEFMEENHVSKLGDLVGFNDFEIEKVRRNLAWMRLGSGLPKSELRRRKRDFRLFFSEHDRRRGTSLVGTFPELEQFWNECGKEL